LTTSAEGVSGSITAVNGVLVGQPLTVVRTIVVAELLMLPVSADTWAVEE
jgi:hypothetical protein